MNRISLYILVFGVSIFSCGLLSAQEELPAEEVEVVKDFEIKTKEGTRIQTTPEAYSIEPPTYNYEYEMDVKPVAIEYPAPYIRPVAMQADEPIKYYNGYIKGGFGSLENPHLDAQYDLIATDYYTIGGKINFTRLNDNTVANKKYGQSYVDLHADYFLTEEQLISFKIGGDFQNIHAFGFNHLADTLMPIALGLQNANLSDVFLDASYANTNAESNLSYGGRIRYDRISAGLSGQKENNFKLEVHGNTLLKNSFLFDLRAGINTANLSDANDGSDAIIYANPSISFSKGKAGIKLGATFANGSEGGAIFPDAELRVNLSRQAFILELGADGEYVQQGLKHLSGINPFLAVIENIEDSKQYNFYAGLSGHLKKDVSYSVRAGYKLLDNLGLFVNDYVNNQRLFTTVYDYISSMYLSANISLAPSEELSVKLGVTKQILEPYGDGIQDVARAAWHMVPLLFESKIGFSIIPERLKLTADLYLLEGLKFRNDTGGSGDTDFGVDLNFGLDAKIIERISAFVAAKNILSNNYERWNGYENFGANFLGGIKVKL